MKWNVRFDSFLCSTVRYYDLNNVFMFKGSEELYICNKTHCINSVSLYLCMVNKFIHVVHQIILYFPKSTLTFGQ